MIPRINRGRTLVTKPLKLEDLVPGQRYTREEIESLVGRPIRWGEESIVAFETRRNAGDEVK